MACLTADGTLTASGQAMLRAVRDAASAGEVAAATGLPLYRVRSGLRELAAAGLVTQDGGRYLEAPRPAHPGPSTAGQGSA
jgi:DNA-binding IclR family transcriptional regulator